MADYDGTNWGRIDENAANATSTVSNPFDVFLTRSLEANSEFLSKDGSFVSATMLASAREPQDPELGGEPYRGGKPWCSFDRTCHLIIPIRLTPGDKAFEVAVWASIFGGSVEYEIEIVSELTGGDQLAQKSGTWSEQTVEDQGHLSQTMTLSTPITSPRWAILRLWTRSTDTGGSTTQTTSGDITTVGYRILELASDPSLSSPRPALTSTGVASIRFTDADGGGQYDVIAIDTVGTNKRLYIEPGLQLAYPASIDFTYRYQSMVQVRSIGIARTRIDGALGGTLGVTQAKKSPRGRIALRQAYRYEQLHGAESLLAFGPTGHRAPVDEETAFLPRIWRIVVADATSGNPSKVLDEAVMLKRTGGTLKVAMLLSSHYHANQPPEPSWSEWKLKLKIQKSSGTGWVNVETEVEQDVQLDTHMTQYAPFNGPPLSVQRRAEIMDRNSVRTNRLMSTREGALWEADMGQLQFVEIPISLDSVTNPETESLRVLVEADYTGNAGITANSITAAGLGDLLDLTCYGYAIYQE